MLFHSSLLDLRFFSPQGGLKPIFGRLLYFSELLIVLLADFVFLRFYSRSLGREYAVVWSNWCILFRSNHRLKLL